MNAERPRLNPLHRLPGWIGARGRSLLGTLFALLLVAGAAQAQLRVDISGTGAQQYPVAIADFSGDAAGKQIAEVIRADLTRSGQFRLINATGAALTVDTPIAYDEWRTRGADFIAYGTVVMTPDGRYDVRYRLGDTVKKSQLDGVAFSGTEKELRRIAHQIGLGLGQFAAVNQVNGLDAALARLRQE